MNSHNQPTTSSPPLPPPQDLDHSQQQQRHSSTGDRVSLTSSSNRGAGGRSIKEMKNQLLNLLTSFRGNQLEWSSGQGDEFKQLLQVCHLQYHMAHIAHLSARRISSPLLPPNTDDDEEEDAMGDVDLDAMEAARREEKFKLSLKFDELSRTLTQMTTEAEKEE